MPIQQSVQTLIRADDFHDKAFRFTVESVVDDIPASHRDLVVTVSEGYHMTTSLTSQPSREQTFEHTQQPNRQWVASGTIILAYAEDYPKPGVLTIQNPVAETVVLPIEVTQALTKNPGLTVSPSALSFTQTTSDKPDYLLLTITQPLADTPITLTTDAPAYFQLASDSHPYYSPTLTVVSPVRKFHVHVRYAASKRGVYKGQLTIQTPYDSQTITLLGRRTGWWFTKPRLNISSSQPQREPASRSGSWVLLALLVGISGIGYMGYTYKCQLFPDLCRNETPKAVFVNPLLPRPDESRVSGRSPRRETKAVEYPEKGQGKLTQVVDSLARLRQSFTTDKPAKKRPVAAPEEPIATTRTNVPRRQLAKKAADQQEERSRPKPASVNEESELEKALNKPL